MVTSVMGMVTKIKNGLSVTLNTLSTTATMMAVINEST